MMPSRDAQVGHRLRWTSVGTQRLLPDIAKDQIRSAYERAGPAKVLVTS